MSATSETTGDATPVLGAPGHATREGLLRDRRGEPASLIERAAIEKRVDAYLDQRGPAHG